MVSNGCFLGMINSSFTLKNDTYPVVIHRVSPQVPSKFYPKGKGKTAGRGHKGQRDREELILHTKVEVFEMLMEDLEFDSNRMANAKKSLLNEKVS
ncbi:hypothetical protein GOBAR_AA11666 [Gossypium barbadense]|uniref:Uncharacterized protein n=1 Tax=Gossypium barbadense TaxID=3634 RepID=A0A2P5Y0A7_GOSBA|nr:hypothetical protein GOBAR_AA11666 [Gossypium barbadense]